MQKGFGLLEVVIGAALVSVSVLGVFAAFSAVLGKGLATTEKLQATLYAEEGLEAARYFRDSGWDNVGTPAGGTAYYIAATLSGWATSTTPALLDGTFTRTIIIDDVYRRDSDKDIVPADSPDSKTIDTDTRRITATVSWEGQEVTLVTYLSNIF